LKKTFLEISTLVHEENGKHWMKQEAEVEKSIELTEFGIAHCRN